MNTPYVKKFEDGECKNPITRENPYLNTLPNRSQRRSDPPRFHGESNNIHLTINGRFKYQRYRQRVLDKKRTEEKGKKVYKWIEHYIERKGA